MRLYVASATLRSTQAVHSSFENLACRRLLHHRNLLFICWHESIAVQSEKIDERRQANTLIAIDERMVLE